MSVVELQEALGRARRDRQSVEGKVGTEGRRIGLAEPAVEGEGIEARRQIRRETLSDVGLIDVAGADVISNRFDSILIAFLGEIRAPCELVRRRGHSRRGWRSETIGEPRQPAFGARCACRASGFRKTSRDERRLLALVVDRQKRVVQVEGDVVRQSGSARRFRDAIQPSSEIVREIADRRAGKGWKVRYRVASIWREAGSQRVDRAAIEGLAVQRRSALAEAELGERIRRQHGDASERFVTHRAVKEGQIRHRGEACRRFHRRCVRNLTGLDHAGATSRVRSRSLDDATTALQRPPSILRSHRAVPHARRPAELRATRAGHSRARRRSLRGRDPSIGLDDQRNPERNARVPQAARARRAA